MLQRAGSRKRQEQLLTWRIGTALLVVLPAGDAATRLMAVFSKEMSILEALESHPQACAVFEAHGMSCPLCICASSETIETGAIMHQVDPEALVAELDSLVAACESGAREAG
ncbi:MAG TPA: DUF1858 domain-containing protein [Thermoleophilia bacterium]|nr:DUF1858 domain-containing protein [Thermoleophilia bacterium]HQG04089.1 DUF1858 domain-containing protein [Thermoleophilia bacterium]HQG54048.1 DUF1858 domain-containing protein [Thermoleophilia bacterium]HQJ96974.1 DUF1858 domain-containing protein [Thermoleophilia bacterium]